MSTFAATAKSGRNKRSSADSSSSSSSSSNKSTRTAATSNPITSADGVTNIDDLVFEDPYEDEWGSSSDDEEQQAANDGRLAEFMASKNAPASSSSSSSSSSSAQDDVAMQDQDESTEETDRKAPAIWRGNVDELPEGQVLDFDESTYITHHAMRTQWPCLSFDIIRDKLGSGRTKFPMTSYLVAGTQADQSDRNEVLVMKVGDLHKTMREQVDEDDSDDDLDDDPYLLTQSIPHVGGVNRIRSMPQASHIVATWSETSDVHVFDVSSQLVALDASSGAADGGGGGSSGKGNKGDGKSPVFTYTGHKEEGFAMAWSSVKAGRMVTGDCSSGMHVWDVVANTSTWSVDASPYVGHTASVEDVQWSNTEENGTSMGCLFLHCLEDCF